MKTMIPRSGAMASGKRLGQCWQRALAGDDGAIPCQLIPQWARLPGCHILDPGDFYIKHQGPKLAISLKSACHPWNIMESMQANVDRGIGALKTSMSLNILQKF